MRGTRNSLRLSAAIAVTMATTAALPGVWSNTAVMGQEVAGRLSVDFVALGPDGLPMRGLTANDVRLRIDGRERQIRTLRAVVAAPLPRSGPLLPPPYGTSADSASGRRFALVVDDDSFRAGREQPLRNAIDGLLDRLTTSDVVMLITMPYGGVKVPLTTDHLLVRHAVLRMSGQRPHDETGSAMACRTKLVLQALEGFLSSFAGRTTPTTVVLFTAGMAAPRRDAPMALAPGMCELQAADFQRIGGAAGAARANFYIVQPDDLGFKAAGRNEAIGGGGFTGSDNPLEGIEHLSGVTKGERVPLEGVGPGALTRVANETAMYYVAEISPDPGDLDGRSRQLEVRSTRADVTIRARPRISFGRPWGAGPATRVSVSDMLLSAASFTDLPMRAAAYTMGDEGEAVLVVAVAEAADRALTLASAGAALVDPDGQVVARWSAPDAREVPLMGAMLVPPGRYRLRVAAVDAAGRAGAADYLFDARLIAVGPLSLGSLILGLSRDNTLTPRLEFGAEPSALGSFEIYGGVAGTPVTATLEVAHTLGGAALVTVPLVIQSSAAGRYVAMGTVPIGALPAGDYVVRGVIRLGDGTTGQTVRTLRKR